MDFLNATTRAPWGFMPTTDDVYGVKVMAEGAGFLDWLRDDCRPGDRVEKLDGDQTIYRGNRVSPDGSTSVATVANMAGPEVRLDLTEALTLVPSDDPHSILVSPEAELSSGDLRLPDGSGVAVVWSN